MLSALTQYIDIINTDQQLMSFIYFHSLLIFLDLPNGLTYSVVEKQWW